MYIFYMCWAGRGEINRPGQLALGGEDNQGGGQDIPGQLSHPGGKLSRGQDKLGHRRTLISPIFNQGVETARPVLPLNDSYHKIRTVTPFLLDCIGLLPIPGHVIDVSWRRRRGSGVRCFGAKETQPV